MQTVLHLNFNKASWNIAARYSIRVIGKNWWKNIEIAAEMSIKLKITTYFLFWFSLEMKSKQIWNWTFLFAYLDGLSYWNPLPIHSEQRRVLTNNPVTWIIAISKNEMKANLIVNVTIGPKHSIDSLTAM